MKCFAQTVLIAASSLLMPAAVLAQQYPGTKRPTSASCGPLADQLLRCPKYGFTYKTPFGWVDRTEDMQRGAIPDAAADSPAGSAATPGPKITGKPEVLLAIFARPPGAVGTTVDSAVVIATESAGSYPGLKSALDYFGPVTELAEQDGFKVANDPYEFTVTSKRLVRGDFSQQAGALTMWQSTLVTIEKGQIVSFTFLGESEDEVDELISNLSFAAEGRPRKASP